MKIKRNRERGGRRRKNVFAKRIKNGLGKNIMDGYEKLPISKNRIWWAHELYSNILVVNRFENQIFKCFLSQLCILLATVESHKMASVEFLIYLGRYSNWNWVFCWFHRLHVEISSYRMDGMVFSKLIHATSVCCYAQFFVSEKTLRSIIEEGGGKRHQHWSYHHQLEQYLGHFIRNDSLL